MIKVLFVCTHNRCRSILCEAIVNQLGEGKIQAFSAGSVPAGQVHPLSLKFLEQQGYATDGLRSQSWDEFASTPLDLVVTVCDSAANEACPLWMGETPTLHWGLPDPSKVEGSDAEIEDAFLNVMARIEVKVTAWLERGASTDCFAANS